jgi:hypothetical protein
MFSTDDGNAMAYDDLETDHHLTPKGWIGGDSRFMGKTTNKKPIPPDRVLTITQKVYQRSMYSSEEVTEWESWRGSISDEDLRTLRKKFPFPK